MSFNICDCTSMLVHILTLIFSSDLRRFPKRTGAHTSSTPDSGLSRKTLPKSSLGRQSSTSHLKLRRPSHSTPHRCTKPFGTATLYPSASSLSPLPPGRHSTTENSSARSVRGMRPTARANAPSRPSTRSPCGRTRNTSGVSLSMTQFQHRPHAACSHARPVPAAA